MTTPVGFENKVSFIWKIADKLRGHLRPHEYGSVMLPTLVLFRLDAVLEPTKQLVVQEAQGRDLTNRGVDHLLKKASGHPFYNTSPLTLKTMLSDDKNIAAQLQTYIAGLNPAAAEVLDAFRYQQTITRLDKAGVLYAVLGDFADLELHPNYVSNEAMGYIFEELLRKFSEMSNETAGEHYTPREVIALMVDLLFAEDSDALSGQAPVRTVYDPAAGTGGMLITASNHLRNYNAGATVQVSGQELNPESWAIARSELLMRGEPVERMAPNNSLTQDAFAGEHFDYLLANPPYGVDWKAYADPIRVEAASGGANNRFSAGLPRISDGSFLFLQHMISKMKPRTDDPNSGSRIAIVLSGSPLFSGGAGSGESEIRRWIIENDWLEGVVALPDQMFYNTGISTYVWIVSNRKPAARAGTVTLVDARELGTKMRKSLGDKRKALSKDAIAEISRLFTGAVDIVAAGSDARVKVMPNQAFGFARLTVERPMRRTWRLDDTAVAGLSDEIALLVNFRNWSTLAPLRLPRPPARVQHQIADFLDDQAQWIARVIAAREAQLLLLREEREAEINSAILGQRGSARSIADLAVYENGFPFKPSDFTEGGLPVVRIQQLNDPTAPCDFYDGTVPAGNRIDSGDLIFSWSGSLSVGVWNRGAAILNQHLFKVSPSPGVDGSWLRYALDAASRLFEPHMHGTGMTHITRPMMKALRVPLPAEQEQRAVGELLGSREAIFDDHFRALRHSTQLMRELRTSLVTEVVLGQFDVSTADGSRVPV